MDHRDGNPRQRSDGAGSQRVMRPPTAETGRTSIVAGLNAEAVPSHIAAREWRFTDPAVRERHHLLVICRGRAAMVTSEDASSIDAPAIVWLPPASVDQIEVPAGSCCGLLGASSPAMLRCVGQPGEIALDGLLQAASAVIVPVAPKVGETIAQSIDCIADELRCLEEGALPIVSYELTLCLMRVWREVGELHGLAVRGNVTDLLQRFRRLVEERFREHLSVSAYARLLGISSDRLHAVCTRVLRRSPRTLLQQRLLSEAIVRLERPGPTIKQVAFALGFKDTGHFNRFFHQHMGQPPGSWRRRRIAQDLQSRGASPGRTFADWP